MKVTTKDVFAPFLANLAIDVNTAIVPKEVVEEYGDLKTHPVGTGPFKLVEWRRGDRIIYERNEDYRATLDGDKLPYLDKLIFVFITESETKRVALGRREIDGYDFVPPMQIDELKKDPTVDISVKPVINYQYVSVNTKAKPFDDVNVRRAVMMAIDKDEIIRDALFGHAIPAIFPMLSIPGSPWYMPDIKYLKFDPEEAKKLLTDAGYPNGFKTEITAAPTYEEVKYAEITAMDLKKYLNIDVTVKKPELTAYIDEVFNKHEHVMTTCGGPSSGDPDPDIYPYFHSTGGYNHFNYSNSHVDELLDKQRLTLDVDERKRILKEVAETVLSDAPIQYCYHVERGEVVNKYVKGYVMYNTQQPRFDVVWVDKSLM